MRAFARRWLSGDERTLGAFLAGGVLVMAFFRLDRLRGWLAVEAPLTLVVVLTAVAWWSLLPRSFVWLDPADLTWRDVDRVAVVSRRLTGHWLGRMFALGYLLALLAAVAQPSRTTVAAGVAVVVGAGLLALAVVRRPRGPLWPEALTVLAVAALGAGTEPVVLAAGAVLAVAGLVLVRPGPAPVVNATRQALVDGWRERVLRVVGIQFLDLAMLLPAARPVRPHRLTTGLRLAWAGVLGRTRHLPTAVLLGVTAVAAHRTVTAVPDIVVFAVLGYLALVPLTAGLGELWRSPGRRRWVGLSDISLRWHHFLVATGLAAVWGLPVCLLGGMTPVTLVAVPVLAAAAVRTMTRPPPSYDDLAPVDTPFGKIPVRLVLQTTRGPDLAVVSLVLTGDLPYWGAAIVLTATAAIALLR